jgi:hypothetical protein
MRRIACALISLLLLGVVTGPAASATATEPPPCTNADAHTLLDHAVQGFDLLSQGITDRPIVDLVQRCQYRLQLKGEHTFRESDVFLGGTFYYYTMAELDEMGWTRQQGIDDLKLIETHVFLARKLPGGGTGTLVEQNLLRTPFTDYNYSQLGLLVYTQVAIIAQLTPGDYVSVYQDKLPGEKKFFEARVTLHIVPG